MIYTRYSLWKHFENFIFFIHLFHSVTKWGKLTNCIINDKSALSYCRNCNSSFFITKLIICGPIFASKVFLIRIAPREDRCLYYTSETLKRRCRPSCYIFNHLQFGVHVYRIKQWRHPYKSGLTTHVYWIFFVQMFLFINAKQWYNDARPSEAIY